MSTDLYRNCLGISNSLVKSSRLRKSISVERTFFKGLVDIEHEVMNVIAMLESRLENLSDIQLENRMIGHIYIKIRYQDFTNSSREILLDEQSSLSLQSSRSLTQRNKDDVLKSVCQEALGKQTVSYTRNKPKRQALPEHLPREVVVHDIDEADNVCDCCGGQRHQMGEDRSEQLEYVPAKLKVIEHVRPKYSCRTCEEKV